MARASEKILITGALGYLGGRITSHLVANSPESSLRLMTRPDRKNLPDWVAGLDVVRADLHDQASLQIAVDGIDTVVHLAAMNEIDSQKDPDMAVNVNGLGTQQLLTACREKGVRRFIYLSTFHVYGPGASQPITEQSPTRPIHPYAFSHRLAEDYVNWSQFTHGMETLILRLSNGYGYPADSQVNRWTLVFNDLATQAVQKGEITLRSSGTQHRDFISLTDVARGIQHFLDLPSSGWGDGLFNLGGECSMSIKDVAEQVAAEYVKYSGKAIPVTFGEDDGSSSAEPVLFSVDKLKKTGFHLTDNMSEEIIRTFQLSESMATSDRPGI